MVWGASTLLSQTGNWAEPGRRDIHWQPGTGDGATNFIHTAGELAQFAHLVNRGNAFAGATFVIARPIDLGAHLWTPAGTNHHTAFAGTLAAAPGAVLEGLAIDAARFNNAGLFGTIAATGCALDLVLTNAVVTARHAVGLLAGSNAGTLAGCAAHGTVNGGTAVGGIAGANFGRIENCTAHVTLQGARFVGGLVGYNSGVAAHCVVNAVVGGDPGHTGGLAGCNALAGTLENCYWSAGPPPFGANDGTAAAYASFSLIPATGETRIGFDLDADNAADVFILLSRNDVFDGASIAAAAVYVQYAGATSRVEADDLVLDYTASAATPSFTLLLANGGNITLPGGTELEQMPPGTLYDVLTGRTTLPTGAVIEADGLIRALPSITAGNSYDGFIYRADECAANAGTNRLWTVRGRFTLTESPSGRITANLTTRAGRTAFAAKAWTGLDDACSPCIDFSRNGWNLLLSVREGRVWGRVRDPGGTVYHANGIHRRFHNLPLPAARALGSFARYYTASLSLPFANDPGTPVWSLPVGHGYLTLTAGATGNVRIAGKLADGTFISQSSPLLPYITCGQAAAVPFFIPLYNGRGSAGGLLWLMQQRGGPVKVTTIQDSNWAIRWENGKTDGFTAWLSADGFDYDPDALPDADGFLLSAQPGDIPWFDPSGAFAGHLRWDALTNGIPATLADDGSGLLLPPRTLPVADGSGFDFSAPNSARAILHLNPRTGIYNGSVSGYVPLDMPDGTPALGHSRAAFGGVLLQNQPGAFLPLAPGYGTVLDTEPGARQTRRKHSFPVHLEQTP